MLKMSDRRENSLGFHVILKNNGAIPTNDVELKSSLHEKSFMYITAE